MDRLGTFSPVATSSARALGERVHADRAELVEGSMELDTGVDLALLAPQPFPVEQVGAGELDAYSSSAQVVERVAEVALREVAFTQQRS
jgi:hypothetical protein